MAGNASLDDLLGSRRCSVEDSWKDVEQSFLRGYVLNALVGEDEGPMVSLSKFVYLLELQGPRKMVSLFPELEFNALNVVEYELHYVILTLSSPMDFSARPKTFGLNFPALMDDLKSTLSELEKFLKSDALLDEEQALRVDAHCKKIADAHLNHRKDLYLENSQSWQPFFSEHFSTETEKVFMTRLREICLRVPIMAANEALKSLADICQSADMDTVLSSDVLTHNAMRMVIKILINVVDKPGPKSLSIQQKNILIQKFSQLNSPSSPSSAMRCLARRRIQTWCAILERIELNSKKGPKLLDEKTLGSPSSALWQKLSAPAAAAKYSDPDVFKHCAICASDEVTRKNFAILDVCDHLYCADCISRCYFEFWNSKCPFCRQEIREFTTRDFFLSKVKEQATSDAAT